MHLPTGTRDDVCGVCFWWGGDWRLDWVRPNGLEVHKVATTSSLRCSTIFSTIAADDLLQRNLRWGPLVRVRNVSQVCIPPLTTRGSCRRGSHHTISPSNGVSSRDGYSFARCIQFKAHIMEDRANQHRVPIPKLDHPNLAAMRGIDRTKEERV